MMDFVDQQFLVTFRYPVHFTRGVFAAGNPLLHKVLTDRSPRRPVDFAVVLDEGMLRAHPRLIQDLETYNRNTEDLHMSAPPLVVPGGEDVKNDPRHLQAIYDRLHDAGLCRQSCVVVVGGGAVLDAAGYAAATAHRGLRLVRIPTTVLAQDDSGMGVKNGVNAFGKKNYLGAFAPPFAVINDFEFLPTLSDRDWLSGISEAIKAALIKDPDFFVHLEHLTVRLVERDQAAMEDVIRHSAALHLSHIATGGDPFEQTSSRPLDFGHWAAHKLEQLSAHRLRHGEAVAIGIALDSTYSHLAGHLDEKEWRRIIELLVGLRLAVSAPELEACLDDRQGADSVLAGLAEFREHLGGVLTVMLLRSIGDAFDVHEIDTGVMMRSIETLARIEAERTVGAAGGVRRGSRARGAS
jgi:3-dehydroquinate synthase